MLYWLDSQKQDGRTFCCQGRIQLPPNLIPEISPHTSVDRDLLAQLFSNIAGGAPVGVSAKFYMFDELDNVSFPIESNIS